MKKLTSVLTALAFTAAFHGADAQSAPAPDPDAKLKVCVADALEIVLPTVKPFTREYDNRLPPTYNVFYDLAQGDQMESGHIAITRGQSGPSTLNIKINIGPTRDQYRQTKLHNAFTELVADKGNVFKKAMQSTTAGGDEGTKYQGMISNRAGDILSEIRKCMVVKPALEPRMS